MERSVLWGQGTNTEDIHLVTLWNGLGMLSTPTTRIPQVPLGVPGDRMVKVAVHR